MTPSTDRPSRIVHQEEPRNSEPSLERLTDDHLTPKDAFFVRSHAPVPDIDPDAFRLRVGGEVEGELSLSLDDLRRDFEQATVMATLQCAGNRRDELMAVREIPGEVPWRAAAIGNARWTGVRLRDVLAEAGLDGSPKPTARHVAFTGLDRIEKEGEVFGFGGSIPLEKAMDPHVLLAWEMNGEPLPPDHGFPLRVVVPGYIGARSVKWLGEITVQPGPSDNYYQARAYKLFPPHVTPDTADWDEGLMLGELPVQAVITRPAPGRGIPAGSVRARGYAVTGGDRTLERVDVSTDGGSSWTVARFTDGPARPGVWRF
ncbi:MAG: molybdopterin-dependent oxidoreductase, partial [Longimicrobiales bacterium]|nr:molybdopterin-dependent oxidoreductase [Longimicrobiales bacterium]